jgi:homocysteine S-methyltransferase
MERAGEGTKGREEGIAIAREALQAARALGVAGAYVMPPLQRYETAVAVIRGLV